MGFGFQVWTTLSRGWAFIAATFIILVPLIQEIHAIWRQYNLNLKEKEKDSTNINSHEGNGDLNQTTKAGGSKRGVIFHQLQQTASYVIKGSKTSTNHVISTYIRNIPLIIIILLLKEKELLISLNKVVYYCPNQIIEIAK